MKLTVKHFLLLSGFLIFLLTVLFFGHWCGYLYHLSKHQVNIYLNTFSVDEVVQHNKDKYRLKINLKNQSNMPMLNKEQVRKIEVVQSVKKFAMKKYNLPLSRSYKKFINLERQELGWSLLVAYPLKLQLKTFYFPFIGSFSYLSFFNLNLLRRWIKKFQKEQFDVSYYTIGGYSTLGYLDDPIFSTYLYQSEYRLANLIFHEIAHEKLYFTADTMFSEALASYIAAVLVKQYYKNNIDYQTYSIQNKIRQREYQQFVFLLNKNMKALNKIFQSKLSTKLKIDQKKIAYQKFQKQLQNLNHKFKFFKLDALLRKNILNNALLLGYHSYNPRHDSFDIVLNSICKGSVACWFNEIKRLQNCTNQDRQKFIDLTYNWSFLENSCLSDP